MPGFGCLGGDDGGEHGGLAVGGEDGAVGLAGDLAGLEDELAPTPVELNSMNDRTLRLSLTVFAKGRKP